MESEVYVPASTELDQEISKSSAWLENLLKKDKFVERPDTASSVVQAMERIKISIEKILKMPENTKETSYWAMLNGTHQIFKWCRLLRKSQYARDTTKYLAFCMVTMESNIILTSIKHLPWRITLYTELAEVYEQLGAFKAASKVIIHASKQVQQLKEIEEVENPVPDVIKQALVSAIEHVKSLDMKYGLLLGTLTPDQWKKRLEEFPAKPSKIACALKCLNLVKPDQSRIALQSGQKIAWKSLITTYAIDLVQQDIQVVAKALKEIYEKKGRDTRLLETTANPALEHTRESLLATNRQADALMTKETVWKKASQAAPLEIHIELLKHAYDCRLWDWFYNLSEWADIRLLHRRIEAPLVKDLDVIYSALPDSKIPKTFEKIDVDLNIAHLKQEMVRLGVREQVEKGKEENKKEEKKQEPPKSRGKGAAAPQQKNVIEPPPELPTVKIDHSYVYLVQKKQETEDDALISIEIKMADERSGPNINPGDKAVSIPIEQYNKSTIKVPYMVVSKFKPENEEMILKRIIDVQAIISKHPDVTPPEGYIKIPIDLRQTPEDQERVPNNTYVYICYRTEEKVHSLQRDYRVLHTLRALEQNKDTIEPDRIPLVDKHLSLNWDVNLLDNFSREMGDAIIGPSGDYFSKCSPDILLDVCLKIWDNFVNPVLKAKEIAFERYRQGEIEDPVMQRWNEVRPAFEQALEVLFRVFTSRVDLQDPITLLNIGLNLAQLQEESGNLRYGVQTLRIVVSQASDAREHIMKRGVRSALDKDLASCISCDLETVKNIRMDMKSSCIQWEHWVAGSLRSAVRKRELDEEEYAEEEWEVLTKIKENEKNVEESSQFNKMVQIPENEIILFNLHTEALASLYRCELQLDKSKTSDLTVVSQTFTSKSLKPLSTKGLSAGITAKLSLSKGKTATKIRKDTQELQQALQESGKLPPKKATPSHTEKILISDNAKNPYQQALLYLNMSKFRTNSQEQKSILKDAMEFLENCEKMEKDMGKIATENAPQVEAAKLFNSQTGDNHLNYYPFKHLADNSLAKPLLAPPKPTVIARTPTSIAVKLPFFKPKIVDKFNVKTVNSLALFGKEAKTGTNVSLTNYDYEGLNVKQEFDNVLVISGLTPFEAYHFAAAAYTEEGECIGGIGETCESVVTLFPLPIPLLWSYLAETAFELGHLYISFQAIEKVLAHYLEPNFAVNLLQSRLNMKKIYSSSYPELRHLSKAILIYVECLIRSDQQKERNKLLRNPAYKPIMILDRQQREHKLANLLVLALDLSIITHQSLNIKKTLHEILNTINQQFFLEGSSSTMLHLLSKIYISLQQVPNDLWDSSFRKISCVFSNLYIKSFLSSNEPKLTLTMNTKLPIFKYEQQQPDQPQLISLKEKEFISLYEITLQHIELQEISKGLNDKMKESLLAITAPEEAKQAQRKIIDDLSEFWNGIKSAPDSGFAKLNTMKDNPRYLEFMCKCLWSMIDKGAVIDTIILNSSQVVVPALPPLEEKIAISLSNLEHDCPPNRSQDTAGSDDEYLAPTPEHSFTNLELTLWTSEWFLLQSSLQFIKKNSRKFEESKGSFFIKFMDVGSLIKEDSREGENIEAVLLTLMKASNCAASCKAWKQLENIAKALWNVLNSSLTTPESMAQNQSWKYIACIAEDLLLLLVSKKEKQAENEKPRVVSFAAETKPPQQTGSLTNFSAFEEESEVAWFLARQDVDIHLYSNIVGFAIQCLLVAEKWEYLQYICFSMNLVTQHYFAGPVLPFKIYAERALYERAKQGREQREKELEERKEKYENWKLTSKRRKSRQALITGEIPQEQIEFERDCKEIIEKIERKRAKEIILLGKLNESEAELEQLKKGASNAEESLMQSRKLLEQYGNEARNLQQDSSDPALKVKKRAHKVFANMVLSSYRKTVELLRKRQEKWLLAQALNELGNLCFSEGILEEAETSWNDSVDTVFQSLYIVQNFRKVFSLSDDNEWRTEENLADKYGVKECLLAGIVLWKLASTQYESKNMKMQLDCVLLARLLFSSIYRLSLPHPQHPIQHSLYRMRDLAPNLNLFEVSQEISLGELGLALDYISVALIDRGFFADAIPLLSFLEYVGVDYLWNSAMALKSRSWKVVALAQLGYPEYSLNILQKIIAMKDLPKPGIRKHLLRDKEHHYYKPKMKYNMNLPPEAQQNQEIIQALMKLDVPPALMNEASLFVYNLTVYAKSLLLLSLAKSENIDNPASEGLRNGIFTEIEKSLRYLLKNLSFEDELARIKSQFEEENGNIEEFIKARAGGIEINDVPMKEQIVQNFFRNDESLSDGERKVKRLELIGRIRLSLVEIKQAQGDLTAAIRVARQSFINLQGFSQGKLLVELGAEQAFAPIEKVEEKKEPAKKGGREATPIIDANREQKQRALQEFLESWEFRNTPGPLFWLKIKEKLCSLLYLQSRYNEALNNTLSLREEAQAVSEPFFWRFSYEIEAYVSLRQGNMDKCIEFFEKMRSEGEKSVHSDPQFIFALANYSELLLERGNFIDAFEAIALARQKIWKLMDKNGFVLKSQDINRDAANNGILIIKTGKEEVAKAPDPKDKNKAAQPVEKAPPKEDLVSVQAEADAINGTVPPNIYLLNLEQFLKLEISYVKAWMQEDYKKEKLKEQYEIIDQAEVIAARILHLTPPHFITLKYLKAQLLRLQFVKGINDFQNIYRGRANERHKYKKIAHRFPDYDLGSGKTLLHLPNFSRKLIEEWLPLLDQSKAIIESSIQIAMKESLLISPHLLFYELYHILILQREYRPRIGFKYLPNPGEENKETSYEELLKAEQLKVHKITKDAIKALQIGNDLYNARDSLRHQFSQFATSPVSDINKVPKTISQEILESDYLQKKQYPAGLFEESKKKIAVTAIDLITYLIKQSADLSLFHFGREFRMTRLYKLHRILNLICQPYMMKCKFQLDPSPPIVNPNEEILPSGTILGFWEKRRTETGEEMQYLCYITSPLDIEHIVKQPLPPEQADSDYLEFSKKDLFLYGEIRVDEFKVSNMAQSLRDLKDKVKKSLTFSKEKCERDLRLYAEELKAIYIGFAAIFCPEIERENKEEVSTKAEKVTQTVNVVLPQVNEEKVGFFSNLLWSGGFSIREANISALMRFFHSLRYIG
ncbi:unnamed protein product [Blepharisma stoltei]|uniref:Uncharacterized protein n=1 Tax=Blepharisma stoltei TaxID=1481888 RepID=A0AAU9JTY2_9CILI|nr:unnamed protein product [Blepharisma stoltei]